ncbi:MAG: hypothetical protein KAJ95_07485 [Gammaproteobacteria bacterium]|nr:hypothetical protein [Gammaproteobacteria bacterium]
MVATTAQPRIGFITLTNDRKISQVEGQCHGQQCVLRPEKCRWRKGLTELFLLPVVRVGSSGMEFERPNKV